jgi:hypothetical protein
MNCGDLPLPDLAWAKPSHHSSVRAAAVPAAAIANDQSNVEYCSSLAAERTGMLLRAVCVTFNTGMAS